VGSFVLSRSAGQCSSCVASTSSRPSTGDHAYEEVPLPLPGERATISCPHSDPRFYEPPGLGKGHRFLKVGVGSGHGTSPAREVVGPGGVVVAVEIDATTLAFARENLGRAGDTDPILVHGDGGLGRPQHAPYDRICVTAACPDVPLALIEQLAARGRLIAPVLEGDSLSPEDRGRHSAQDRLGRAVRAAAATIRRRQRCA
jgi:protein-L-isoaspartate(D-aspartate) O-methyltransferase